MILATATLRRHLPWLLEGRAMFEVRGEKRIWVDIKRDGSGVIWIGRAASNLQKDGAGMRGEIRIEGYPMEVRVWRDADERDQNRAVQAWRVEFRG